MPLNYTKLEKRLSDCDNKLTELFKGQEENLLIQQHLAKVKKYYNLSYEKAEQDKTIETLVKSYEFYVQQLSEVKDGTITRDTMLESINYANDSRKLAVIYADLAKACELMFWVATGVTLYASIYLFALPMLLIQPVLGIATSITIGMLLIKTAANAIQCLSEFRSFGRHNEEYVSERTLLSFFKPEPETDGSEMPDSATASLSGNC